MVKIYQQHNPSKLNEIDTLMAKYAGNEHVMYLKICNKYQVQPEPEIKAPAGPSSSFGAPGATGGGLFGGGASSGGGLFGQAAPGGAASSGGGLFGQASPSGGGLFGQASPGGGASSGGGLFGQASPSGGGLFGQASPGGGASSGGGMFGQASPGGLSGAFGASPSALGAGGVDVKQAYRERMIKIYQQHNPSKVNEIDALMGKYVGQEHTMYLKICKKYNVQPEPEIRGAASPGLGNTGGGLFGGAAAGSPFGGGASSGGGLFGGGAAAFGSGASSGGGLFGGGAAASPFGGAAASSGGGLFGGGGAAASPFGVAQVSSVVEGRRHPSAPGQAQEEGSSGVAVLPPRPSGVLPQVASSHKLQLAGPWTSSRPTGSA
ncbi:NUP145 [Symbiodinium natans]|uniref:NUP145 protein n=1 Tax=Symbiodinium natans TaxID=878477 RepID=A0A812TJ61_9DINO|nr:NUP145 [Symbiodinium natans]